MCADSAATSPGKVGRGGLGDDVAVDDVFSGFKRENDLHCLARARTNMKNTKETVYHCYNSCEMLAQFDELLISLLITSPYQFFINYLEELINWS